MDTCTDELTPLQRIPLANLPEAKTKEHLARRRERRTQFFCAEGALLVALSAATLAAFFFGAFWMTSMATWAGLTLTTVFCAMAMIMFMIGAYAFMTSVECFVAFRRAAIPRDLANAARDEKATRAAVEDLNERIDAWNAAAELARNVDVGERHLRLLIVSRRPVASMRAAVLALHPNVAP